MAIALHWRRLHRLELQDRRALREAVWALTRAAVEIRLRPFKDVVARATPEVPPGIEGASEAEVRRVRWAVEAVARRLPIRLVCFQKGLAAHRMLRRRGIASVLHYGVRQDEQGEISAHVWVSVAGVTIIGGEEAPRFTCLATFPPSASDRAGKRLRAAATD